jgi:hypothetical protein
MPLNKKIISVKNTLTCFQDETLKIKLLSHIELLTSLDRLTRFKYPPLNRNRVYEQMLTSSLISPKINLKKISTINKNCMEKLVGIIWNKSVQAISGKENSNKTLNKYLAFEETKTFSSQKILEDLITKELPGMSHQNRSDLVKSTLEEENLLVKEKYITFEGLNAYDEIYINTRCINTFDIASYVEYLGISNIGQYPPNILRIIKLWTFIKKKNLNIENIEDFEYLYKFQLKSKNYNFALPARLLVIAEGNTEEILLPTFCEKSGLDFSQKGIHLIAAGGKNQVLKIYNEIKDKIAIPVFILLDSDGIDIKSKLQSIIKSKDIFYIIEDGEFEDILKPELVCKSINNFYKAEGHITIEEINQSMSKTKLLSNLWKEKGFGAFNKSAFAKIILENTVGADDISQSLTKIIQKIEKQLDRS